MKSRGRKYLLAMKANATRAKTLPTEGASTSREAAHTAIRMVLRAIAWP